MKYLITLFLLTSNLAFGYVAPSSVASECAKQMAMGVCMATPDRSTATPGQTMLIAGMGRVQYSAYLDYMDKYNPANPSDPAMCDLALVKMTAEPGSDHDKIARALWQPVPEPEPQIELSKVASLAATVVASVAAVVGFVTLRKRREKLAK